MIGANEPSLYGPVIWLGTLHISAATFFAVARHVGGFFPLIDLMPLDLIVTDYCREQEANDYISDFRRSESADIALLALTTTGKTAKGNYAVSFDLLYHNRLYGLIRNEANPRGCIYLIPVPAGKGIVSKSWLDIDNIQLPKDRPEPLILVALVLSRPNTSTKDQGTSCDNEAIGKSLDASNPPLMGNSGPRISEQALIRGPSRKSEKRPRFIQPSIKPRVSRLGQLADATSATVNKDHSSTDQPRIP